MLYEVAITNTATTAGAAYFEFAAPTRQASLLELGVFLAVATASSWLIGRPGNTPAGGTIQTATKPTFNGAATASTAGLAPSATTAATVPAAGNTFRRFGLPGAIGNGVVFTWNPLEMIVGTSRADSVVVWGLTAVAASGVNCYAKFIE